MLTHKHSKLNTREVLVDLEENHKLSLSNEYLKATSDYVGSIAQSKEEIWSYDNPVEDKDVHAVAIGIDGAMMYLIEEDKKGYREAMTGTIALYNKEGVRLHTNYIASTPEYGKENFYKQMEHEIKKVKKTYPQAKYIGIADGAACNWPFLEKHTAVQITDFFHATEYLKEAALAIFEAEKEKNEWLDNRCHAMKHDKCSVVNLINEMTTFLKENNYSKEKQVQLNKTITYFTNQSPRMDYYSYIQDGYPIGSGVTEAACKKIIKHRFCQSGMKWKEKGSAAILSLRCLESSGRWTQFWGKINKYGIAA